MWGFFVIFISMKKLLILVSCVFFTFTTFAQSERDQKVQKRVERDNPPPRVTTPTTPPPVVVTPGYNPYYQPYYGPYNYGPNYYGRNSYRYNNRNYRYNNRYYRRSRVTPPPVVAPVRTKKNRSEDFFALGLASSMFGDRPAPFGGRLSLGSQSVYLFGNYQMSRGNRVSHYDNITLADVLLWEDVYERTNTGVTKWDVGMGFTATEPIHPTLSVGVITTKDFLVYRDELNVLSSNGLYSINGGTQVQGTVTFGVDIHTDDLVINTGLGLLGPPHFTFGLQMRLNE